mmetsp:Transcript_43308/g.85460  ORF Transcript_43308/g.85460 Transcript_43308/m.85460 type:complete len:241 (-) Transcript_43308:2116-2838(-)
MIMNHNDSTWQGTKRSLQVVGWLLIDECIPRKCCCPTVSLFPSFAPCLFLFLPLPPPLSFRCSEALCSSASVLLNRSCNLSAGLMSLSSPVLSLRFQGQTWADIHCLELLEQQFASIRKVHAANVLCGFAERTEPAVPQQATLRTNGGFKEIRRKHQTLNQQITRPVRNEAVPFHLSQSESPVFRSSLCRLVRQRHPGTAPPRVDLVLDHVFEPLVENRTNENVSLKSLPCDSARQVFLP